MGNNDLKQLNLGINLQLDARISDFAGDTWIPIIDAIRQLHAQLLERFHVYGPSGSGKSHLLTAICESYIDSGKRAIKISLADLIPLPTESLFALENYDLIALDDLQLICGYPEWQEAVFHLINRTTQGKRQLVFASQLSISELPLSLRDLASRIALAPSFKLPEGNVIRDREAILSATLERRQLAFDQRIIHHLIYNGPAQTGSMIAALNDVQELFEGLKTKRAPKNIVEKAKEIIDRRTEMQPNKQP